MQGTFSFLSEAHHANPFQSQASEEDWLTRVATWPFDSYSLLVSFVQIGLSGRTSLESCHLKEDGILQPSSGRWQNSGMGSPTEFWTLSGLESPSAVAVCSLSRTLETGDVPQRYFLSAKACAGILRRAERRGKKLPPALKASLEMSAANGPREPEAQPGMSATTSSHSRKTNARKSAS